MSSRFMNFNPNPLKKKTGDCVVRSLVMATGYEWDTVYRELFEIGFELKVMPNSDEAWKEYLIRAGFTYHSIPVKRGSKRPTVERFCENNDTGTFVLRVANHIVASVDGYYHDTWDSGECCLYGFWEKPETL